MSIDAVIGCAEHVVAERIRIAVLTSDAERHGVAVGDLPGRHVERERRGSVLPDVLIAVPGVELGRIECGGCGRRDGSNGADGRKARVRRVELIGRAT
jgi:hypothetical protein